MSDDEFIRLRTEDPPFLESLEILRLAVFTSFATFADGRKVHKAFLVEKYQFQKDSAKIQSPLSLATSIFPFAKMANQIGKV